MLAESGIDKILDAAGCVPVRSYAMHTVTWRDLDFERAQGMPDWERHWEKDKTASSCDSQAVRQSR